MKKTLMALGLTACAGLALAQTVRTLPCLNCGSLSAAPMVDAIKAVEAYGRCGSERLRAQRPPDSVPARAVAEGLADDCADELKPFIAAQTAAGKNPADVELDARAQRERWVRRWLAEVLQQRAQ